MCAQKDLHVSNICVYHTLWFVYVHGHCHNSIYTYIYIYIYIVMFLQQVKKKARST